MKKLMLIFSLLILFSCTSVQNENVFLSSHEAVIESGQNYDLYIGIKNNFDSKKDFKISYDCDNCDDDLVLQMFPDVGLEARKSGAFPIRIISSKNSAGKDFEISIIVNDGSQIYGSDDLRINIQKSDEDLKLVNI